MSCCINGCTSPSHARGWCRKHYERWRRHGDPNVCLLAMVPKGTPMRWIKEHSSYNEDGCLIWPFSRFPDGRAQMKDRYPSRVMCEIIHGPPPSPIHEAAHSCGNANSGCVSPKHLRWATPIENAADKIIHGTLVVGEKHYSSKLTNGQVKNIRKLYGRLLQRELAKKYNVNISCINKIVNRRAWKHVP